MWRFPKHPGFLDLAATTAGTLGRGGQQSRALAVALGFRLLQRRMRSGELRENKAI